MKVHYGTESASSVEDEFQDYLCSAITNALKIQTKENGDFDIKVSSKGVTVIPYYPVDRPIDYSFYT